MCYENLWSLTEVCGAIDSWEILVGRRALFLASLVIVRNGSGQVKGGFLGLSLEFC